MNTIKGKVNKIILGLTSVGLVLLMLPVSLSANHFRYGTMSWENPWDNGTIRLKMENGWTANHSNFDAENDYDYWAGDYVGSIKNNYITIYWGDGSSTAVDIKILSRDASTTINNTISEMGDNSSSTWTTGVTHTYSSDGDYVVYWYSYAREATQINNGLNWRNETKVNIGGANSSNISPVGAVPSVVQVQDNKTFNYQLVATDANGDSLNYRWGTQAEFFWHLTRTWDNVSYVPPTGMTLSSSGLIGWDVRDSVVDNATVGTLWGSQIMVEDLDSSGNVKSYVPLDFFFKIAHPDNDPPAFQGFPSVTQTVSIGTTKTITFTSTDDSGVAPTISVLNLPSSFDNSSIWDKTTSTSGGVTTFSINFTPDSSMGNKSYAVNIRSTDNDSMTKDKTIGLYVSTVSNADPVAPSLVFPADNSTVTEPVTFQWEKSTDPDNDAVSYNIYICTNSGFVGCSGTSVTAGVNFNPPFNQNFHDNMIPWPSPLHAATVSQQISQDSSMIPKWVIMLGVLGLLSGFISLSVKNITHRRIVFMFIFLTFFFSLTIISCGDKDEYGESWEKKGYTPTDLTYTTSDLTTNTTYYWKVIASDTKGGSAESETWSFTVQ
jgi:hypothetical protein